jgi:trans-aconitate methyltransferase
MSASQFDQHADTYDADLNRALSVSGEDKEYFARARVEWLARCLRQMHAEPQSAIDYGCGTGDTSVLLRDVLNLRSVLGLDVSVRSLELARARHAQSESRFLTFAEYAPQGGVELVYCNGVFHHIPVAERPAAVDYIYRSLRPGGVFALWENNPWNPGTRYVMSQCLFDRDAKPLASGEVVRLLQRGGFNVMSVDFLFLFPRLLRLFRLVEPHLARLPLRAD